MFTLRARNFVSLAMALVTFAMSSSALAQLAFGVSSTGDLFRFDVNSPSNVQVMGNLGVVTEAIDFRPGTNTLYGIDVGPNTTQVYTINITTGAATPVGPGFNSSGAGYDLAAASGIGFDFNPTTLQFDSSMRIRVVGTNGSNLRLNSSTGLIEVVDGALQFGNGNSAFVDAAAYINNNPTMGGTTQLFDMDSRNNALLLQSPPNDGTLATVGNFGLTIDANSGIGFDIFTIVGDADSTIGGDTGYAVFTRDATAGGAYLLYDVNLATGATTNGQIVGPANTPFNFVGGFAVAPLRIPEPSSVVLAMIGALSFGVFAWRRRRSK